MKTTRTILPYALAMAALIAVLKFVEYRYFIRDFPAEIAFGLVALLFTGLGVWAGLRLTRRKVVVVRPDFTVDLSLLDRYGISKREYEVLELIAQGMSNREIAAKLFISLNTVKTHSSSLFSKLGARRRTQALQRAKELGLLA
jgi:NarL family two-component system response regulator LiaR